MKEIIINDKNLVKEDIEQEVTRVKGLILNSKGKILIAHNNNTYQFPGGHTHEGESLDECIIREIKEEIGIDITHNKKELIGISEEFMNEDKTERYLQLNYKVELSNEPKITLSSEHVVYDWTTKDDPKLDAFLKEIVKQWEIHK